MAQALDGNHVMMTYVRGTVELRSVSQRHAIYRELIGLLVRVVCMELRVEHKGAGSMTIKHSSLAMALEPDGCFWIDNVQKVMGLRELNFLVDPPPDLVVELEISKSQLDRMSVFAALGVPEVWRHDGKRLTIHVLRGDRYVNVATSPSLEEFPAPAAGRMLALSHSVDDLTLHRQFQTWVRRWLKRSIVTKGTP